MIKAITYFTALILTTVLVSCNLFGPRESELLPNKAAMAHSQEPGLSRDLHKVVVQEVLPAAKYVYLRVQEADRLFWIATRKQAVNTGETYFYREALMRAPFESKEHGKVFDTLYLVTKLVPADHATAGIRAAGAADQETEAGKPPLNQQNPTRQYAAEEGYLSIAELAENPEKYAGQQVQLKGECVKVNQDILNRNWLHLKDGSKDSYDLIITSDTLVPAGTVIAVRGDVAVDKDFGAGYKYRLIIENGVLIQP